MTKPKNNLELKGDPSRSEARNLADLITGGMANAATITNSFSITNELALTEAFQSIRDRAELASSGNLADLEKMLVAQTVALDNIFTLLAMRARNNLVENIDAADRYMRLALKAQSQCRTTIETLAEIKHPKPFIQNNKAQYQQINNGINHDHLQPVCADAHARENQNITNELLEDRTDEQQWMDGSKTQAASRNDQAMATVET